MPSVPSIGQLPAMRETMPKQKVQPQTSKPSEDPQIQNSPAKSSVGSKVDVKA